MKTLSFKRSNIAIFVLVVFCSVHAQASLCSWVLIKLGSERSRDQYNKPVPKDLVFKPIEYSMFRYDPYSALKPEDVFLPRSAGEVRNRYHVYQIQIYTDYPTSEISRTMYGWLKSFGIVISPETGIAHLVNKSFPLARLGYSGDELPLFDGQPVAEVAISKERYPTYSDPGLREWVREHLLHKYNEINPYYTYLKLNNGKIMKIGPELLQVDAPRFFMAAVDKTSGNISDLKNAIAFNFGDDWKAQVYLTVDGKAYQYLLSLNERTFRKNRHIALMDLHAERRRLVKAYALIDGVLTLSFTDGSSLVIDKKYFAAIQSELQRKRGKRRGNDDLYDAVVSGQMGSGDTYDYGSASGDSSFREGHSFGTFDYPSN